MKHKEKISRREFFRTCGRLGIAGGMAAFAAVMWKKKDNKMSGQDCLNQGICPKCPALDKCELPQAMSLKKVKNG